MTPRARKDTSLEFLRGMASIFVFAHHIILAFFPAYSGMFDKSDLYRTERSSLVSFASNGTSAVVFFFLLSGFVLSKNFFADGDRLRVVEGAVKRWPRLAGPVLMSVLLSWLLIKLGAYRHEEVGRIVHSPWLKQFAYAYDDGRSFPSTSLRAALSQGLFRVFFANESFFNTNLWTMRYEFAASFLVFGLCLTIDPHAIRRRLGLPLCLIAGTVCFFISSYYLAFIVGVGLALMMTRQPLSIPTWSAGLLIPMSLYLLGYYDDAVGPFTLIRQWLPIWLDQHHVMIVGAVILIFSVEACVPLRRVLSYRLAAIVGELSFPLYLVHIPLISAVGCRIFLHGQAHGWNMLEVQMAAVGSTTVASLIIAVLLMYMNRPWLRLVTIWSRKVVRASAMPSRQGTAQGDVPPPRVSYSR